MKNGKKRKKKLFMEHLEKRVSTSPLLVQVRSAEGLSIVEKFKKLTQPHPEAIDAKQVQSTNLVKSEGVKKPSCDKFLKRMEEKQKNLNKMAISKEELLGKKVRKAADNKFVGRIEKKQEYLAKMAVDRRELTSRIKAHGASKQILGEKLHIKSWGLVKWIKSLVKKHSDVYDPYAHGI